MPVMRSYSSSIGPNIRSLSSSSVPVYNNDDTRLNSSSLSIATSALHRQHQSIFNGSFTRDTNSRTDYLIPQQFTSKPSIRQRVANHVDSQRARISRIVIRDLHY
jgi:hypothetical protein